MVIKKRGGSWWASECMEKEEEGETVGVCGGGKGGREGERGREAMERVK